MLELNKIYNIDCLEGLKQLPDNSINCCVTSPPYWRLRDYGVEGQLGLESTPEEYVSKMVEVFREVKRVLRKDGTLWLNLGDSYNGSKVATLKPKDLVGIPWMVAFAFRADGWYLRSDIIWHKSNPMPESVTDRPTKAHEYIFLLTKKRKYFYDREAIREPAKLWNAGRMSAPKMGKHRSIDPYGQQTKKVYDVIKGANRRTVWTIATQPYPGAHFATFPPKLIELCILAGTSPKACEVCGAPWERVVEKGAPIDDWKKACGADSNGEYKGRAQKDYEKARAENASEVKKRILAGMLERKTTGWQPTCTCQNEGKGRCIVLDPFMGSGTTGMVAAMHQRNFIGFELNPEYCKMAEKRIEPYLMRIEEDEDWRNLGCKSRRPES